MNLSSRKIGLKNIPFLFESLIYNLFKSLCALTGFIIMGWSITAVFVVSSLLNPKGVELLDNSTQVLFIDLVWESLTSGDMHTPMLMITFGFALTFFAFELPSIKNNPKSLWVPKFQKTL